MPEKMLTFYISLNKHDPLTHLIEGIQRVLSHSLWNGNVLVNFFLFR